MVWDMSVGIILRSPLHHHFHALGSWPSEKQQHWREHMLHPLQGVSPAGMGTGCQLGPFFCSTELPASGVGCIIALGTRMGISL